MKRSRVHIKDYTVGWVCALPIELAAAQEMLDEEHFDLQRDRNDTNLSHSVVSANTTSSSHAFRSARQAPTLRLSCSSDEVKICVNTVRPNGRYRRSGSQALSQNYNLAM
ncbi:hypothetical protein V2W45_1351927 [Cenococcum geophilum]